jgi:hypothetical protein
MTNPVTEHPNAVVGGGAPTSVAAILYLLGLFGVDIPDPSLGAGIAIGGGISALALLIGRVGIRGIARHLWGGRS